MTAPYALTQLSREQWETLQSLVETRRYSELKDPLGTEENVQMYEGILSEIQRTLDNSPDLKGKE